MDYGLFGLLGRDNLAELLGLAAGGVIDFKARAGDVDDAIRRLSAMPRPYPDSLGEVVRGRRGGPGGPG